MKKKKEEKFHTSHENKKIQKILKIILLILLLALGIIYFMLKVIYESGPFTVSLDENLTRKSGLIMYEDLVEKEEKRILKSETLEFMDNISVNWIPKDIDTEAEGSHNGENYIAYTFYLQNMGQHTMNYWYTIPIDDVIKEVDTAIRVMVFINGEKTIYAKEATKGGPEPGTEEFFSKEIVAVECREDFNPGDIDRFTIVIWLEGDDPECLNHLIGGQMKMHMDITGEQIHEK